MESRPFFDGNPKMIFLFGMVFGIALTLVFGPVLGLTSGRTVNVTNNQEAGTDTDTGTTAKPTTGKLAAVTYDDHVRGNIKKAKVVLIEYADYECPYCGTHHPTMLDIMAEYGDDVAWVYRHFPLSFHPQARPAALAAECVNEQDEDKFWEFSDTLFENQSQLSADYYAEVAAGLGLNLNQFNDCVDSAKYADVINSDLASGQAAGVTGTPATFVNGQLVSGAVPLATFTALIDGLLE